MSNGDVIEIMTTKIGLTISKRLEISRVHNEKKLKANVTMQSLPSELEGTAGKVGFERHGKHVLLTL